jgi:threonine synthase
LNDESVDGYSALQAVNSINWARILAQIVYYFYGYFRWLELGDGNRKFGDKVT